MSDELFTACYVDEGMPKLLVSALQDAGFDVIRAEDLGNTGLNDREQLLISVALQKTFITDDKNTFLEDSKALETEHAGIIILTKQVSKESATQVANIIVKKYLNHYTKEEWNNLIVYL